MTKTGRPGTPAPRSGIYVQVGPNGESTDRHAVSTAGKRLPPTTGKGRTWELVKSSSRRTIK